MFLAIFTTKAIYSTIFFLVKIGSLHLFAGSLEIESYIRGLQFSFMLNKHFGLILEDHITIFLIKK